MITLDGKHIEEFGYRALLDHYHEAIPNIRRKTMTIPGMSGRWDFGSELESKPFEIPIQALSDSSVSLQALQNELVAFLMDEFGNPRELKMVFDYEQDKFYTVKIDGAVAPVLRAHILRNKTLPLIAHDPFKYSNVESDSYYWGNKVITFEYPYTFEKDVIDEFEITEPKTKFIDIDGVAVQPVFEITGSADNFKIWNDNYEINVGSFSDMSWEIDCKNYVSYKNGIESIIDMSHFYLMPGNNPLRFTGTNIDLSIKINFREKYN